MRAAGDPAAAAAAVSGNDAERDDPKGKSEKMNRNKAESSLESRSSDNKGSDRGGSRPRLRKLVSASTRGRHSNNKGNSGDSSPDASEHSDGSDDPKLGDFGDEKSSTDGQSKRTGAKREEKKVGKRKRLTLHDLDDQDDDESDDSASLDRALDKNLNQTSVTSKPSSSLAIPKKRALESTTPSTSSLLANLKPAPPPVDPQQPPSKRPPTSNKAKISTSFERSTKTTTPSHSPARGNSPKRDQQAMIIEAFSSSAPTGSTTTAPLRGAPSKSQTHHSKGLSVGQQRVMSDLEQVCNVVGQDLRFSLPPSTSIDLSGSFLTDHDDKDDFFDLNDAGEIVLQPRVPIFPEEFPPGVAQHSLAWWGVLDPDLGDGKYKPEANDMTTAPRPPPMHGSNGTVDPTPPPPSIPVPYYALPAQAGPRSRGGYRGGGGGRNGGAPPPAYWRGGASGAAALPSNRAPRLSPPREFERR